MPLALRNLLSGGIHTSDNWTLHTLFADCRAYNNLGANTTATERIAKLNRIAHIAGIYVTSKPPQAKAKNQQRWLGIHELLESVGTEIASCGARMLTGPTDYRTIKGSGPTRSYWLEYLDPMHRPGFVLSPKYQAWVRDPLAIKLKLSFWNYVGTARFGGDPKANVAYLAESRGAEQYKVQFDQQGGLYDVINLGTGWTPCDPFHTKVHETAFSGDGWAIFVVSPEREIYSASHIVGKLHHSSFLSGKPVLAAGELVVDHGVIKVITAKSGHYMPTAEDLQRFVQAFPQIPGNAIIRPDLLDESKYKQVVFYTVADFRANHLNATPLTQQEVRRVVPGWAVNGESNKVFNLVPSVGKRMQRILGATK